MYSGKREDSAPDFHNVAFCFFYTIKFIKLSGVCLASEMYWVLLLSVFSIRQVISKSFGLFVLSCLVTYNLYSYGCYYLLFFYSLNGCYSN